jgi:putative ABC transport system permease protein
MTAPRWALALLTRLASPDRVDDVLGDLEEAHRKRVARRGRALASALTAIDALDTALALIRSTHSAPRTAHRPSLRVSWLDVKLGLRMLVKYPGLSLVGGLGIAVAVAIGASVFATSAIMYAPLPFDEGERVVAIELWDRDWNDQERRILHDFVAWRDDLGTVRDLGAYANYERNLIVEGGLAEPTAVAAITASAFRLARVPPLMGRPLVPDDEAEGAPPVVVIGYDTWQRRFGADPNVVGRVVRVGNAAHTVVGVMPEGFGFPISHNLWMPFRFDASDYGRRDGPGIYVFGRLAPGSTLEQAQAELNTTASRAAQDFPETHARLTPRVMPYTLQLYDDMEGWELPFLFVLVMMLLVVVCVNVAVLVYARTATRTAEIAVRSALGASRRRIVTQLFVEALVLSVIAALVGVAVAAFAFKQVGAFTSQLGAVPFWMDFGLTPGTVLYALLLAMLGAAIVGIVPALNVTGRRVQAGLQHVTAGGARMRLGGTWTALIVSQVAITVAALPAAFAVGKMAVTWGLTDPGFPADEYLTAQLRMDAPAAETCRDCPDRDMPPREAFDIRYRELQTELVRRLEAEPEVTAVTVTATPPGMEYPARIEVEGEADMPYRVGTARVDAQFFDALDAPILTGRPFHPEDAGAPVAIVNQSFVRLVGGNAIGRRVRFAADEPWLEVIGVTSDFSNQMEPDYPTGKVYRAIAPGDVYPSMITMRIATGSPVTFQRRLREITMGLDPTLRLREVFTLERVMREEQAGWRIGGWGLGALTLSVLLLAAAGIYAMMSFTVAQRRREIGIRTALGAHPRQLLKSIFARALRQLGIGVAVGLGVAAFLDLGTGGEFTGGGGVVVLVGVAAFMMAVGLLAALGPARRGLRIQPTEALKEL